MKNELNYLLIFLTLFAAATLACGSNSVNVVVNANANTNAAVNAELAATPASASAESQASAAAAVVADLYKQHDAKKSPFFQTKSRALVDKYFTKALADLIWNDAITANGEVGALDGDPLYNAQDMEIKNFAVGTGDVKGDTATVPVTFTNFGQKQILTFVLKLAGTAWKIDDIKYSDKENLRKWLQNAGESDTEESNSFDGRYQVGDTTCMVTPSKMSYAVKWAKGSGTEMFFFKEGNTFESSPDSGGPNQFVFDNPNYNTGTFNRADGKTFQVKRLK